MHSLLYEQFHHFDIKVTKLTFTLIFPDKLRVKQISDLLIPQQLQKLLDIEEAIYSLNSENFDQNVSKIKDYIDIGFKKYLVDIAALKSQQNERINETNSFLQKISDLFELNVICPECKSKITIQELQEKLFEPNYHFNNNDLLDAINSNDPGLVKYVILNQPSLLNKTNIDYNIKSNIIARGNYEMIHLFYNAGVIFSDCFDISISFRLNNIADWILENFNNLQQSSETDIRFNIRAFVFYAENGLVLPCYFHKFFKSLKFLPGLHYFYSFYSPDSKQFYQIIKFCYKNDYYDFLEFILKKGNLPDIQSFYCALVKFIVINKYNQKIYNLLKSYNIVPPRNIMIIDNQTPVTLAYKKGNIELFKELLSTGADLNYINGKTNTILYYACKYKDLNAVKSALSYGVDIRAKSYKSALYVALHLGKLDIANYLVDNGFDCSMDHCRDSHSKFLLLAAINSLDFSLLKKIYHAGGSTEIKHMCINSLKFIHGILFNSHNQNDDTFSAINYAIEIMQFFARR